MPMPGQRWLLKMCTQRDHRCLLVRKIAWKREQRNLHQLYQFALPSPSLVHMLRKGNSDPFGAGVLQVTATVSELMRYSRELVHAFNVAYRGQLGWAVQCSCDLERRHEDRYRRCYQLSRCSCRCVSLQGYDQVLDKHLM